MEQKVYSVADITRTIKTLIEESLPPIWLVGEISNFKEHHSGHMYFSLKDANAQISAVIWRTRAEKLNFPIQNGQQIKVLGNIRLYEKSGRYQIDILQAEPYGKGDLQQAFEALKKKLFEQGLFSEEYKKPIPSFPFTIALITSPTGAAIQDMLNVLKRRAPYLTIIIRPTKVQGIDAEKDIANAVEEVNRQGKADVIILGRGGGSLEDLWAFNEEMVALAIHNSKIPVISAVGHEVDFTISDFVADMRAPTPSAAAELAVTDKADLIGLLDSYTKRMTMALQNRIILLKDMITGYKNSYGMRRSEDTINQKSQRIDELNTYLISAMERYLVNEREKVSHISQRLALLDHRSILARGYSLSRVDGKIISDIKKLKKWQVIETELQNGKIESTINQIKVMDENG